MELALGAATACVSRSGASSLAEMAAIRLPSALVPLPTSADNHQFFNAAVFEKTGAAILLDQKNSTPAKVADVLAQLVSDEALRFKMQGALVQWHSPNAAEVIAENILKAVRRCAGGRPGRRWRAADRPAAVHDLCRKVRAKGVFVLEVPQSQVLPPEPA